MQTVVFSSVSILRHGFTNKHFRASLISRQTRNPHPKAWGFWNVLEFHSWTKRRNNLKKHDLGVLQPSCGFFGQYLVGGLDTAPWWVWACKIVGGAICSLFCSFQMKRGLNRPKRPPSLSLPGSLNKRVFLKMALPLVSFPGS